MKTGLVLEGGACRGVFTSGVLDEMLERGLTFDYCIGVSAGAGNAMNFKSRQVGRALQVTTGTGTYYGLKVARATGKLLDLDWVYNTMSYEGDFPFDFDAYYHNPMEAEYTLTCCETAQPEYFSEQVYQKRLLEIVKASCSMPGICDTVALDGKHYLDGGIAAPLPLARALEKGCDRVVIVTTKPRNDLHPTNYRKLRHLFHRLYGKRYPLFYEALMDRIPQYYRNLHFVDSMVAEGKAMVVGPEYCNIKSLEKDKEKMREYYAQGRQVCRDKWEDMMAFLENGTPHF